MNFTHRKILFSIFFKPFIHFPGNNDLQEKEKEKWTQINTVPSARPRYRPGLPSLHSRCPHPAKPRGRARPPGPASGPSNLRRPLSSDGRASMSQDQNRRAAASPVTLASFLFSLSSSLSPAAQRASAKSEHPWRLEEVAAPPRAPSSVRASTRG